MLNWGVHFIITPHEWRSRKCKMRRVSRISCDRFRNFRSMSFCSLLYVTSDSSFTWNYWVTFMFRKSVLRYFMRRRENDWTKPRQQLGRKMVKETDLLKKNSYESKILVYQNYFGGNFTMMGTLKSVRLSSHYFTWKYLDLSRTHMMKMIVGIWHTHQKYFFVIRNTHLIFYMYKKIDVQGCPSEIFCMC